MNETSRHASHWTTRLLAAAFVMLATLLAACGGGDSGNDGPAGDETAPTTPANLVGSAPSPSSVHLEWQASTDDASGVDGYRVYRNGSADPISTVAGTSFDESGLEPETQYTYTVSAIDGAQPANESAPSAPVTVTTPAIAPEDLELTMSPVFTGLAPFDAPVLALQAPADASTWYVVEQSGRVLAVANDPAATTTRTFVDLRTRVTVDREAGLLGMAFHPSYPASPRVYLSYTTTVEGQFVSRVSEFITTDGGATLAPDSERLLLQIPQPARNHNGGHIAFGPDGLLYIGFGDGGGEGDPWEPFGNGQKLTTLLGKMLRIDIEGTTADAPYRIPAGNPYAASAPCADGEGTTPCPEIFAYGFRNPWRWSFDRATGDLWVADVGQASREEVDRVVAGGNYGWRCLEGTQPFDPDCGPNAVVSLLPLVEYGRDAGGAITGGYVYRGDSIPVLRARYVFGDFISGRLWHVPQTVTPILVVTATDAVDTGLRIASFAEDVAGELYVLDYSGSLHRVIEASAP